MTTTWANLLSTLRSELKDTSATPRWSDDLLLTYVRDALGDYSTHFPLRKSKVSVEGSNGVYTLPTDCVTIDAVEMPAETYLEKLRARPGTRRNAFAHPRTYYTEGGTLYIQGPTSSSDTVLVTYHTNHTSPANAADTTFQFTVPDSDIYLIRLFARANALGQLRSRQATLDRFKDRGDRDDNPLEPETSTLMYLYHQGIANRYLGGAHYLYRKGPMR